MAIETVNGVKNYYGPRGRHEAVAGRLPTSGAEKQAVVTFTGENYSLVSFTIPAGAIIRKAYVEVTEAFALGGTTPTINVGVSGSHGTNYVAELSEAQAEAVGTYTTTPAGTLAANSVLAAAATIIVGLDGTTPTIGSGGQAKVVIHYDVL
jgi:hypothetical protein